MKPLIFSLLDTPAFGGAEQYMFSHLRFLVHQGFEVVLATNNTKVKNEILSRLTEEELNHFKIIRLPYLLDAIGNWKGLVKFFIGLPRALFWCAWTLVSLQKNYSKIICLWPGFSDRLVFSPIARFLKLSVIWIEIGPLEPTFRRNWGFPSLLYKLTEYLPTTMVTTSKFTKESIVRNTHFTSDQIHLVYPGTPLFTKQEVKRYQTRAKIWKQKEHLTPYTCIGVLARLATENEIDVVIRATSEFLKRTRNTSIRLLIIGDGPQRQELEFLVKKLKLGKQVIFCGFVSEEEKRVRLSSCRFFIFPRAWDLDGFGITTIEALSLGIPVLTTDFGPQKEIVESGKQGYRYRPHDSNDLATYIQRMMSLNDSSLQAMKKAAFARVQEFSEKTSHTRMLEVVKLSLK